MTYNVTINFGGFVGCDEVYTVDADSREEAEELALAEAMDSVCVMEVEEEEEEEYEE